MLDPRGRVLDLEIRERVRAALVADEQRVALRVVARAGRRPSPILHERRGTCSGRGRPKCPSRRSCSACSCPRWIIFVPVSACCQLFVVATE